MLACQTRLGWGDTLASSRFRSSRRGGRLGDGLLLVSGDVSYLRFLLSLRLESGDDDLGDRPRLRWRYLPEEELVDLEYRLLRLERDRSLSEDDMEVDRALLRSFVETLGERRVSRPDLEDRPASSCLLRLELSP